MKNTINRNCFRESSEPSVNSLVFFYTSRLFMEILLFFGILLFSSIRRKLVCQQISNLAALFSYDEQSPANKKVQRELRRRIKQKSFKRKKRKHRIARHSQDVTDYDIFDRTGIFEDDFVKLHSKVEIPFSTGIKKRRIFDSRMLLLFVLHFLRENLKFKVIGDLYSISPSTVKRVIHFALPKLYVATSGNIQFPSSFEGLYTVFGKYFCSNTHILRYRW